MGVDYSPVLYVGKEFDYDSDAKEFYERFFDLSEDDEQQIEDDGFQEYCYSLENGLDGKRLNCYTGCGFVLGIDIGAYVHQPDLFSGKVQEAIEKWKELFKDEPFEIVHTVNVW